MIRLSSIPTREFWEIPVLWEDEHVMAVDKPAGLLTSPDRCDPERPSLMKLLHRDIGRGSAWSRARGLTYLANAHRLDFDTSGVLLLARTKAVLVELANLFGSEKPLQVYTAFVQGRTWEDHFEVNAPLAPDVQSPGRMRVDRKQGKRAITRFTVRERFRGHSLVQCEPITNRTHQIRAHLSHRGFPVVSDVAYGGSPLLLSEMKPGYRLKPGAVERPLIRHVALHAEELRFQHPVTQEPVTIRSPQPKVFKVALKYLRKFAQPPLSS